MADKHAEQLLKKVVDELMKARKEQGISHEKLAAKAGLSRPAISFIEAHKYSPTMLSCLKIAKALGLRLGDILNRLEK